MWAAVGLHRAASLGWEFTASGNKGEDEGLVVQCLYSHRQIQKVVFLVMTTVDCGTSINRLSPLSLTWACVILLPP